MAHLASKRLPPLLLLAALAAPGAARANGFALDIQGLFSNGTATAGAAAARDPAGQFANPAVLAALEGTQVVVGGMVIAPKAPYTDGGSTLLGGAAPLPGTNRDGGDTGVAPWLFASHRLTPDLALGFSFTAPFGVATDYGRGSGFYGRYQGVESTIEAIAFGPAIAWRAADRLAFGVSVAARRDRAVIGQAFDLGSMCVGAATAGGDPDPVATCGGAGYVPGGSDGYGRFSATGWSWTATIGATFEPAVGTTLGVGYRHEAKGKVKGHQSFDEATRAFVQAFPVFAIAGEPAASMELPLPDFLTLSASHRLSPSLQLLAAVQLSLWTQFDEIELVATDPANGLTTSSVQGYRNAVRASGAAVYTVRPGIDVFGGVAFEQSPITNRYRQASLPERDSLIAGLGLEAALGYGVSVGAAYQRVQMLGSSRIDQAGGTGDHLVGKVEGSANLGILQLAWRR